MSVNHLAAVIWRLENMSDRERRDTDARAAVATVAIAGRVRSAARSVRGLRQRLRTSRSDAAWEAELQSLRATPPTNV
ncbi:MAG: hypothetical protein J2P15_15965 [Micromonosporaceae bacterium]|nr:hypothetical protein [Micromonosporaceae bacterium]